MKLQTRIADPQRTKKTCFFCRTGFDGSKAITRSIQPFDLMSRRHPLSSVGLSGSYSLLFEAVCPSGSNGAPASSRRLLCQEKNYFFFLATLRVFFAVFFTALFAFLAFLAFLAMLPS
jgi:hypothetical protein